MSIAIKPQKRWMKSVLQTSIQIMPDLPVKRWQSSVAAMRPSRPARMQLRRA